jgi:hypothetical protein
MKFSFNTVAITAVVIMPLACMIPVIADEETTITTTTTEEPVVLKSNLVYVWVDPITGEIGSKIDPTQVLTVQTVPSGSVIVEQDNGRLVGTISPSGKIVSILTAPSFDPLSSAIDKRRSELNRLINNALADGTVSQSQAKDLREQLDVVGRQQASDTSRGKVLTYAESIYLASQLNDVSNRFVALVQGTDLPPLMGRRFIVRNKEVVMSTDESVR